MSKLLREDDYLKLQLIDLVRNKGYSIAGAARELDVGVRSAQEFVNRDKKWAKEWMDAYEAMELEGGVVAGIDLSRVGECSPPPQYKPEDVAFKHSVSKPKVLILDIETAPILANVWALFKQNVGLNMIAQDWYILSWSAKWVGSDEVMYQDKRNSWSDSDDSSLLQDIWNLIDQADWIITQNGVKFDMKKLNARFVMNGMKPPSSYKNIDTLLIAKEHFGFTSNKLEYMTDKLCKRYKKLKHGKFAGFELWKECLLGNMDAWDEMELYNKYDVLSLEELYTILRPWYKKHPNPNLYHDSADIHCSCGSKDLEANGFYFTGVSKFVKLRCNDCGAEVRDRVNLFSKDKRMSLTMNLG